MKPYAELTPGGQVKRLRRMVYIALAQYDLDVADVRLVMNSYNAIFRVDTKSGTSYVLRINLPGERSLLEICSEMIWLAAIRRDTNLIVPKPLPTRTGELVIEVEAPGIPQPRYCAVFSWLDGRAIGSRRSPKTMYKLGVMMGNLHNHADTFTPPSEFSIARLDDVWRSGAPEVVYSNAPDEHFTPDLRRKLRDVARRVEDTLKHLYSDPDGLRFLHADMHTWNAKLHQGEIYMLDFDDSCWLYPVQDMGIALFYILREPKFLALREAMLQGYYSVRPDTILDEEHIKIFTIARLLDLLSFVIASPEPGFKVYVPRLLEDLDGRLERLGLL